MQTQPSGQLLSSVNENFNCVEKKLQMTEPSSKNLQKNVNKEDDLNCVEIKPSSHILLLNGVKDNLTCVENKQIQTESSSQILNSLNSEKNGLMETEPSSQISHSVENEDGLNSEKNRSRETEPSSQISHSVENENGLNSGKNGPIVTEPSSQILQNSFKNKENEPKIVVTKFKILTICCSMILYLADIFSDISLALSFAVEGDVIYASMTFAIVLLPSVFITWRGTETM